MAKYELPLYIDWRNHTPRDPDQEIKIRASKPTMIVFHCTDANEWSPDRLARYFVDEKKWPICGYHFYITKENIYHMVSESLITYHAAPFNNKAVAFSIDYFATHDERLQIPLDKRLYTNAVELATALCIKYNISPTKGRLVGHRELPYTGYFKKGDKIELRKTCPGMAVNLNMFRYDVCRKIQERINSMGAYKVVVDGVFGPITEKEMFNVSGFEDF